MSHIWMSHVTHMNESCHTHEWVVSHTWMSRATHMNESCHTHEYVMSETGMGWLRLVGSFKSHVSFAEYSLFYRALLQKRPIIWRSLLIVATPYFAQSRVKSHIGMSHVTRMNESWLLIHAERFIIHAYTHTCGVNQVVRNSIFNGLHHGICVCEGGRGTIQVWRRLSYVYSYVRHDSFMCVAWLIHMCDMTHLDVWHDSFRCVTWLI